MLLMAADVFHDAVVPVFLRGLGSLGRYLRKGTDALVEAGHDEAAILAARLAPDMLPLSAQVQIATDHAKGATARLTGGTVPRFDDDETRVDQLIARIDRTRGFIRSLEADAFIGAAKRSIEFRIGGTDLSFTGAGYAHTFALPNFYFHLATTYGILRHLGAPLGKRDFLGPREQQS